MIREKIWTRIKPRHFSPVRLSHRTLESFNATFYKNSLFIKINEKRILTKRLDQVTELMKILSLLELFVINIYIYIVEFMYVKVRYYILYIYCVNRMSLNAILFRFCFVLFSLTLRRGVVEPSLVRERHRHDSHLYDIIYSYFLIK